MGHLATMKLLGFAEAAQFVDMDKVRLDMMRQGIDYVELDLAQIDLREIDFVELDSRGIELDLEEFDSVNSLVSRA